MGAWWSGNASSGSVFFNVQRAICQACGNPTNVVMQRQKLIDLLEEARKLTHPDVCSGKTATEVTAKLNACLDEIKR